MGTFIRKHTPGVSASAGTTIAAATAAAVASGNTLVAVVTNDTSRAVSGLTVPVGESASWSQVSSGHVGTTNVRAEVWAIKTTVTWSTSAAITATFSGSATGKGINVLEFGGISLTAIAADHQGGTASSKTVAGAGLSPGDLAIAVGIVYSGGDANVFCDPYPLGGGIAAPAGTVITDQQIPGWPFTLAYSCDIWMLVPIAPGAVSYTFGAYYNASGTPITYTAAMDAVLVFLQSADYPPDTPTLTSMASGGTINRAVTNRAAHTFSSPNYVDSQSKFDLRYRLVGDPSWTTILAAGTTALYYDFAPGDLAAGDYERQVKVYGALGQASAWSTSGFFSAADAPDGPTISYPLSGQSVDQFETVAWSTPDGQESYQFRRVGDDGGDPDTDVIYQDTGEVVDAVTRLLPVNFSVNNRAEHLQLRVKVDDLWSEWDDVPVEVSYTPPPTPTMTLYPNAASLLVVIVNPDPEEGDPAAVSNNIWIDDGKGKGPQRLAAGVSTNGSWLYETPVSGRDYGTPDAFWVEAVAANGTTARS